MGSWDLIVVGSGFASSFFLREALRHLPAGARVLVLERGRAYERSELIQSRSGRQIYDRVAEYVDVPNPGKPWHFTVALGGGSNCWWGNTPRLLPSDFELNTRYGVGLDWPIGYADLEPYYCEVEDIMQVAGPSDLTPFPRSAPYPQLPHRMSAVDSALSRAWPGEFFSLPCARPTRTTPSGRPSCCGNNVCNLCPIDAKFTLRRDLSDVFLDPRVTVRTATEVRQVQFAGGSASSVIVRGADGVESEEAATFVALGANPVFNAFILLKSGVEHPELGRGLHEQVSVDMRLLLSGLDNFDGSTSLTGHGYMLYDGPHRAERGAVLVETSNIPLLRLEPGRWRQALNVRFIIEDLRQPENRVVVAADGERPRIEYSDMHPYARRSVDAVQQDAARVFANLPVEGVETATLNRTLSHLYGTVIMGSDPATSLVDRGCVMHTVRNLAVLGCSAFPTSSPANPTLTVAALSTWAARSSLS